MEKYRLIEVERFLEASLNYVKGTNSCAVEDDFTFERVEQCESASLFVARFRNARNHWRVPIVEQRFDIWDTSYRRRFTVIIPWCTRVQHANKRHARPPDTDSIIVPREIKRLPNMWDSCVPARWMFPTTIVPNGKFRPRKP